MRGRRRRRVQAPAAPAPTPRIRAHGAGARAAAVGALVTTAVVLASCGSGPAGPGAAPPAGGPTTTATPAPTASTLPPVAATGPLQAGAPIALPFSADRVTAAESPDGAVFAAPQAPTSPAPSVAWVVDGNGPAAVAEHVATGIAAMAADGTDLYVATYAEVYAFTRSSGNQNGQWTMPPLNTADSSNDDLVSMTAAAGAVYLSVDRGNTVDVYRIDPSSSAPPRLVLRGLGAVVGPNGAVYYERTDHVLAVRHADGTTDSGPVLAHTPNGLGGGVQYIDNVAGGALWVSEPAGQGLDAQFTTYDTSTLRPLGAYHGTVTSSVSDSSTGPLVLEAAGTDAGCPSASPPAPSSCVFRISTAGALSDAVGVGAAVDLLGPAPAVVMSDTGTGQFDLMRLS